jgi:hypothetical protein
VKSICRKQSARVIPWHPQLKLVDTNDSATFRELVPKVFLGDYVAPPTVWFRYKANNQCRKVFFFQTSGLAWWQIMGG